MTVGSDAHRLDQLSWGLEDGYAIAADAGFSELTFRRGPDAPRIAVPIPAARIPRETTGSSASRAYDASNMTGRPNAVPGRSL